jgi:hypothetical protein
MIDTKSSVSRAVELGGREATVLENSSIRVMIDDIGGMTPELSGNRSGSWINAHWMPWFRSTSSHPYNDSEHGSFWKSNLLYHIAGAFPCIPNFGPGHIVDGVPIPPHGWTADQKWRYVTSDIATSGAVTRDAGTGDAATNYAVTNNAVTGDAIISNAAGSNAVTNDAGESSGALWALSVMESPNKGIPLSFSKIDVLIPGQAVYYTSIRVRNRGFQDIEICAAWHNTLGSPFLHEGCRISAAAEKWMTPPPGGEFDTTTRLALGAEFSSLSKAPLLRGGKEDISLVSAPTGYTDFAAGAVPRTAAMTWLSVINPSLKMAYLTFSPGPGAAGEDDIVLYFNNLWMQYGGRPFTPWAPYEGGPDLTYCLGLENSVSAYAYGLEFARTLRNLLGNPATVKIPGMGQKTLRSGILFAPYDGAALDEGIGTVQGEESALVCSGKETVRFAADPGFRVLRELESHHV